MAPKIFLMRTHKKALEIVPLESLVSTNWSIDDAMTFIVSGGAVAPEEMNYSKSVDEITE